MIFNQLGKIKEPGLVEIMIPIGITMGISWFETNANYKLYKQYELIQSPV